VANPVAEYLKEKKAGGAADFGRGIASGAKGYLTGGRGMTGFAENLGHAGAKGSIGVGGVLAAAGVGAGISKLYDAATKARDFRAMLEENPDLAAKHQENPKLVNRMFTTLRTFNPAFSRDPVVAASYIREMVGEPVHAGGKVVDALNFRDKMGPSLADRVSRGIGGGSSGGSKK
jgi:hypothetical protein